MFRPDKSTETKSTLWFLGEEGKEEWGGTDSGYGISFGTMKMFWN